MTIEELRSLLNKNDVDFEILQNEKAILTVNDAMGIYEIDETAPTIIIKSEKGYFAILLSGDRGRIDFKQIKKLLQCKNVRIASKEEVIKTIGFESGSVPLVGHHLPCVLDQHLLNYPYVYGGVGDANFTLKINPHDLIKVNEIVAEF
ncbi:MAG: YbaK/EbsC family protein [Firmicutes bacterium]|nr:YbaK/EbsC family protein [uncultured Acetobacterium sp.]MBU4439875.1 YbaK/EbsC family protein [Bacillota bacterium]